MKRLYSALLLLAATTLCANVMGQIWTLDFSDPSIDEKGAVGPGNTVDVAGAPFTVDVSGAVLSANDDWFRVQNEVFEARDTDGPAVWTSETINISNCTSADISIDFSESGTMEAADFVDFEYILDGTPTLITNWAGLGDGTHTLIDDFVSTTLTQAGLVGSTLQIRITADNNAADERQRFDNIVVSGSCATVGPDIQITEIHYNPDDAGGYPDVDYEFIELYNAEATSVDLSGYTFTQGITFTFPAATTIAAGEYIVLTTNNATYSGNGYQVFEYTGVLNNDGETLELQDGSSNVIDIVLFADDSPWPFQADGAGPSIELTTLGTDNNDGSNWHSYNCQGQPTPNGTPGAANSTPASGCTDPGAINYDFCAFIDDASCTFPVDEIVINELHYNPCGDQGNDQDFEFLELYNYGTIAIDLSDWELVGLEYTFPMGTSIAAGEYLVLAVGDGSNYAGNGYQVLAWGFGPGLNNNGEIIQLLDETDAIVDELTFDENAPWPTEPDGGCTSLELTDPTADNSDVANWQGSTIFGGTPGAPNSTVLDCTDCGGGATVDTYLSDDFEDNDTAGWTESAAGNWAAGNAAPINGSFSLEHIGAAGTSAISFDFGTELDADAACTKWSFELSNGAWDIDATNSVAVFLVANEADLTSATVDGYAVGADLNADASGNLALWEVVDGAVASTVTTWPYAWEQNQDLSVEVTHNENGEWIFKLDLNGGADDLIAGSTAVMASGNVSGQHFGVRFSADATAAAGLSFDDFSVTQCGVADIYYSVETGNLSGAIWNSDTNALVGEEVTFSKFKSMVVRNGQTVTMDNDVTVNDLTVDANNGAGILNASAAEITLYGDWTNDGGTFNADNSVVVFGGDAAQSIEGPSQTTFEDVTMDNALGLTANNDVTFHGVFYPQNGAFSAGANIVTLSSDASGTGSIGTIESSASFSGTVNMQRFLPAAADQFWVNLCNPMSGVAITDWNDNLITTGFTGSDFPDYQDFDGTLFNNVLQYDESVTGLMNDGFEGASDITDALDNTMGYFVYMLAGSQFVDAQGTIQQGSLTTALTYTSTGVPANDGWELVANRYPSEINFDELYALSTGIADTYYVFDVENQVYKSYTVGFGGTASGFIPSGQSFWVQTIASDPELVWEESIKSDMGVAFERDFTGVSRIALRLTREGKRHITTLAFEEGASVDFEHGRDAFVLGSADDNAPQISFVAPGGEKTTMNRMEFENVVSLPVHVKGTEGTFTFEVIDAEFLPEGICMSIEDLNTGDVYPFEENVSFEFETTEDLDEVRFMLHLVKPLNAAVSHTTCPNVADGELILSNVIEGGHVAVYDLEDNLIYSDLAASSEIVLSDLATGDYRIVYASEQLNCGSITQYVYIDEPSALSFQTNSTVAACNVDGSASIDLVASEEANFSLFQDGTLIEVIEGEFASFSSLNATNYQIMVQDGCESHTITADLTDPNAVEISTPATLSTALVDSEASVEIAPISNATNFAWSVNGVAVLGNEIFVSTFDQIDTYVVEVIATNDLCSASSETIVNVESVVSVIEAEDALTMTFVGNEIRIASAIALENAELNIFDATGRRVHFWNGVVNENTIIATPALSEGMYIVDLMIDGETLKSTKFVR